MSVPAGGGSPGGRTKMINQMKLGHSISRALVFPCAFDKEPKNGHKPADEKKQQQKASELVTGRREQAQMN